MKNSECLNHKTISPVEGEKVENNQKQLKALLKDYFFDFEEKFDNKDLKNWLNCKEIFYLIEKIGEEMK